VAAKGHDFGFKYFGFHGLWRCSRVLTQRRKDAKAQGLELEIDFIKTKSLFDDRLGRQSDPVILRVFAPWRLCVKELPVWMFLLAIMLNFFH
jgi:hypothetical protein